MSVTPEILGRQRRAAWRVWQQDAASREHGDWADLGGLVVHTTGIPVRHWNGAHLLDPSGMAALPRAQEWFAQRGMPWGLLVPEELPAPELPQIAEQRVMVRSLEDLPDLPALPARWDDAAGAAAVQASAFGDPYDEALAFVSPKLLNTACGLVTLYDGAEPVSTATVVLVDGVAAVFGVATVPAHQRRGLGRAATVAVLHRAREQGADLAYLYPSDSGEPVYRALGFVAAPGWRVLDPVSPLAP